MAQTIIWIHIDKNQLNADVLKAKHYDKHFSIHYKDFFVQC